MAGRPIIIDTDPGQDDAIAILLALASPELEVLGITAVAGNVPLPLTQLNARKVCELAGRTDVPVFAGCDRPLIRPLHTAEEVHGKTGLDGPDLPEPVMPLQEAHAVDWIVETLRGAGDGEITLCPLGPLTNIGLAFARAPDVRAKVREIVLMGGGYFEGGNSTPAAEFNIFVDPHAAAVVFGSGVPIVQAPLDVTHKALMPREWLDRMAAAGTRACTAAARMLDFYERFDMERYGEAGGPLHDPAVIAWLLKPELYRLKHVNVTIETGSELTMGMTVMDWWHQTGRAPNARVLHSVDAEGFFELILERLRRL